MVASADVKGLNLWAGAAGPSMRFSGSPDLAGDEVMSVRAGRGACLRLARYLVIAATLAAVAWGGCYALKRNLKASFGYGVRATFEALPADDSGLEAWLASQPGVVRTYVHRDGRVMRVGWIMVQNLAYEPPEPDVRAALEMLGYRGMTDFRPHDRCE